jgi:hypothetical protein
MPNLYVISGCNGAGKTNHGIMNKEEVKVMRNKIIKGIDLAYERLLIAKQKADSELVFSRDGKIVKVKARDLLNEK